jgi:hypothetical protein
MGSDYYIDAFGCANWQEIRSLGHNSSVKYGGFLTPDGTMLAMGSEDNPIRIWPFHSKDIICEACSRLGYSLTTEEWRRSTAKAVRRIL